MVLNILFVGTAGSGKTTLTSAFGSWLEEHMATHADSVNLDAGCRSLPYKPNFDIRTLFTVDELMEKEGLGPNGAIIRASELMGDHAEAIVKQISMLPSEIRLIDTPGQIEIFVFRPADPAVIKSLRSIGSTVVVYLVDPALASTASDLVVGLSLAMATQLRLDVPTVTALSKSDKLKISDVDQLLTDPSYLQERVVEERMGTIVDLSMHYINAMKELSKFHRVPRVSAKTGEGLETLYDLCREAFCVCGEL